MKYMKLEGNYIIAFRDSADCLPAFTAIRQDRSNRRLRRGSQASPTPGRRRLSPPGEATLVITGVPAYVDVDDIRSRLDDCIPGVVKVYRERESSVLPKPPVFVQTNRSIAVDAFMLRSEWVRAVDFLVKTTASRVPKIVVDAVDEEPPVVLKVPRIEEKINKEDLCPHGSYLAAGSCIQCMVNCQGRRPTYISDSAMSRNDRKGSSGSVILPEPEQDKIGGLYELKQRRRSSYEIPVRLDEMFKSR